MKHGKMQEFSFQVMMWRKYLPKRKKLRYGYILESAIFSVYLSVVLQMDFWKTKFWTEELPVWRPLTMM